jgi:hypothetical protein
MVISVRPGTEQTERQQYMIQSVLISAALLSGLQPGDPWPAVLGPAFSSALDSISISRDQLDFDRHWATSVHLADSTVITAIQNIESLPLILEDALNGITSYGTVGTHPGGMSALPDLLNMLEEADSSIARSLESMSRGRVDSLMTAVPSIWLSEDDPVDWDSVLAGWGIQAVQGGEMDMDSLAALLEACPSPVFLDVGELVSVARALAGTDWPGELSVTLPGVTGTTATFCFDGPVRYVVGGRGRNVYTEECPFELIIDLGGDDLYGRGIGGAAGPAGRRISIVMDLAGNDDYRSPSPVSQGCGMLGIGGMIDLSGDDTYSAGDFSQGAGLMGQGFLVDLQGNDTQTGGTFSQGAGCMGEGLLFDGEGDDLRRVDLFGQGFGGPGGRGTLADMDGSDCNLAGFRYSHAPLLPDDNQAMSQGFGMGLRPLIAGGIGLMADFGSGNDTYRAEVFGQGCSYFYSLGMLYDQDGQDSYQAAQYSQGSGIHLAAGCLWDGDGDDSYFSRNGPAQGSAHDLSTGFLVDGGGSDWYCSDGGQSLSLTNSATIFIDVEGSDTYCCRGGGQGDARWARGSSGAAVFIDLADGDFYTGDGSDSTLWTGGDYGVGLDLPGVTPGGLNPQDPVGDPGSLDLDSLFSVASEWEVGPNRDRVLAHRDQLAARGREAVEYLVENHMGTLSGLESRAMEIAFQGNPEEAMELLLASLGRIDSLPARNGGNIVYFLGKLKDERARAPLENLLSGEADSLSTGLTVGVVKALGTIGSPQSLPVILSLTSSPSGRIRRECAVSLGMICDQGAYEALLALAEDRSLAVRSAAEHALELLEEASEAECEAEGEGGEE